MPALNGGTVLRSTSLGTLKNPWKIQIGATTFTHKVLYLNLPNTCYRCQSTSHKIKDCPLLERNCSLVQDSKPALAVTKDEWTTVIKKGKGVAKPSPVSQEPSHPNSDAAPLVPTTLEVPMAMLPPISNPMSQGIEKLEVQATWD